MQQIITSIKSTLNSMDDLKQVVIAYSGGVDSHVLMHACAQLNPIFPSLIFKAVHINHGMQSVAPKWQQHCHATADQLGIEINCISVDVINLKQDGPEQAARKARYGAILELVTKHSVVLTAQHQDDQAETLMLQLLRGCGVEGLASMPLLDNFGLGFIARPFLRVNQQAILDYAQRYDLSWVEDPSNVDTNLDRNFLRQQVIPIIKKRWPAFAQTTSRTARHCAEVSDVLANMAEESITNANKNQLNISELSGKDEKLQRIFLRYWIQENNIQRPSLKVIQQIQHCVIHAFEDKTPFVKWGTNVVRRYKNNLYLLSVLPQFDAALTLGFDGHSCELPAGLGQLEVTESIGDGLDLNLWDSAKIVVEFRKGGEVIKLAKRHGTKKLKALFNENHLFPWVRDRIPLIYLDGQLAAIADLWVAEAFQAEKNDPSYTLKWQHPELQID